MSYLVYVIRSLEKNYTYIGITGNIDRRLHQHNKGYNKTTRPYAPFKLLLREEYADRKLAREREKKLKSGFGREFIASLINS